MVRLNADQKIQPQWWSKTLAGAILGLTLTYALVGIFAWFGPGGLDATIKVQFNMWIISPIWLLILSLTYLFKTSFKAITYLLFLNVIFYSLFFYLRWLA